MSRQHLHSLQGISFIKPEEPSLDEYIFCGECQDYVHNYCSLHGPRLMMPNSKKEENFQSGSPQMWFSAKVKVENDDDEIQNDGVSINPLTKSSEASGKYPDVNLTNFLAIFEQCSSFNFMDTNQRKETQTRPPSSLNVTKEDIDNLLDGNGAFEPCEVPPNPENLAEEGSYLKRIQAQLDEEIMRDLEAEAKIFEAFQVSKRFRFEKMCEENRLISSEVKDIATINDSGCEETENNFHTDIVNEKNAMDYIDDGAEDITQCNQMGNQLVKEMLENLSNKQSKVAVKNNPHTLTSTQIAPDNNVFIKSKTKLQTFKKPITIKKPKFHNNNTDAGKTDMKSKTVIKRQKCQEPIFKNIVYMNSIRKLKERNTYVEPKKQQIKTPNNYKSAQKGNINGAETLVINTTTAIFCCNECGKQFSTKDILTDHNLKCIKPKTLINNIQLKEADMLNSLLPEMYNCDICTFKTIQKRSIETHLKMHNITKVLSCDICEYRCVDRGKLNYHMRTHTGEKPFLCNICEFRCSRESNLKDHIRTHTGEKPFTCNICEFSFSQKRHLKVHIKTHTGEKPFYCDICEHRYAHKGSLKNHIRTHTGDKPFSCNICEYKCLRKSSLITHVRTHTGDKPFSCNICEYKCSRKSSLITHVRTHSGEKPFSCNICEFRCSQKSSLKNHIRTHTGEKPFSCNICEYRSSRKSTLIKHVRTHK